VKKKIKKKYVSVPDSKLSDIYKQNLKAHKASCTIAMHVSLYDAYFNILQITLGVHKI